MKQQVDTLSFAFPTHFHGLKYDDDLASFKQLSASMQFACECVKCPSRHCTKGDCDDFQACNKRRTNEGLKGVDLLVSDTHGTLFLIEAKDYRETVNPPMDHIVDEVAKKFRDTLFGIWCGSLCETDGVHKNFLHLARTRPYSLAFVFHFESSAAPYRTGLFRHSSNGMTKVVSLTSMKQRLKQKLGPMRDYVMVCDTESRNYPWTVSERENER